jgi:hypothetical protein
MWNSPCRAQSALIAASRSGGHTRPEGLPGEIVTIARVRGVIAAASRSGSGFRPAATGTGTPPASWIAITWLKYQGTGRITSSPGSQITWAAAWKAMLLPAVTSSRLSARSSPRSSASSRRTAASSSGSPSPGP